MNSKSMQKNRNKLAKNGIGYAFQKIRLFRKHYDEPDREPEHLPLNPFNMPIVTSTHPQVMKWHMVVAVAMLLVASFVPFDTAFLEPNINNAEGIAAFVLNRILDSIFILDMYLTFHICIPDPENPGCLIKDRALIAKYYFRRWFTLDLVSVFPFDVIGLILGEAVVGLKMVKALRLLRLAKLLRMLKSNRLLLHMETHYEIDYGFLQLAGIVFMLLALCHWLACGWYFLIDMENNTKCIADMDLIVESNEPELLSVSCCYNWLDCIDTLTTQPEGVRRSYILAVVWSTGEMFTTGSVIEPVTLWETQYKILALVVCGVLYACLLGALCNIFAFKTKSATKFFEDMDMLNLYLRSENVLERNPELCVALRTFFRFHHDHKDSIKGILEVLSPALQGGLAYQVHYKWVTKAFPGVFHRCVDIPKTFYYIVAMNLETILFAPMESVIEPHEEPLSVFVVISGVVMSKNMRMKRSGASFGEDALSAWRSGLKRGYQATGLTHGRVYSLKVETVLKVMHRVQYEEILQPAMENVALLRTISLLCWFGQTLKTSILESASLMQACQSLTESINFVDESAMLKFYGILAPRYFRHKLTNYHRGNLAELIHSNPGMSAHFARPILGSVAYFEELASMIAETRKKEVATRNSEMQLVGRSANGPSLFMAVSHKDLSKSKTLSNSHHHTHAKVVRILTTLPLEPDDDLIGDAAGATAPKARTADFSGDSAGFDNKQARLVQDNRRDPHYNKSTMLKPSNTIQFIPHQPWNQNAESENMSDGLVREQHSLMLKEIKALNKRRMDVMINALEQRYSGDQKHVLQLAEEISMMKECLTRKLKTTSKNAMSATDSSHPDVSRVAKQGMSDRGRLAGYHEAAFPGGVHDVLPIPACPARGDPHAPFPRAARSVVRTQPRRSRTASPVVSRATPLEEAAHATMHPHRVAFRHSVPVLGTGGVLYDPGTTFHEEDRLDAPASETGLESRLFNKPEMTFREGLKAELRMKHSQRRPVPGERRRGGSILGSGLVTASEASVSNTATSGCMYTPFYFS